MIYLILLFDIRQFVLWIKENISVNHITHVLMQLHRYSFLKFKEKKKQSRNFFESNKLLFVRTAMQKFIWVKEIFFYSKKLFSVCYIAKKNGKFKMNFYINVKTYRYICTYLSLKKLKLRTKKIENTLFCQYFLKLYNIIFFFFF